MKAFLFADKNKSAFLQTYRTLTTSSPSLSNIIDTPKNKPEYTLYVPNDESEFELLGDHDFGFKVTTIKIDDLIKQLTKPNAL